MIRDFSENLLHLVHSDTPDEVLNYPSMMSRNEKRLLHCLARNYFDGDGCIFDAGFFLGASTMAFGLGLQKNSKFSEPAFERKIHSYDRCIVDQKMSLHFRKSRYANIGGLEDLSVGDSFEPISLAMLESVSCFVDFHIGDFNVLADKFSEKIEILFLDLVKNERLAQTVNEKVVPKLIPGKSIVIHQDFFFDRLPFVNIFHEYIGKYFSFLGHVGPSAVFRLEEKVPTEELLGNPMARLSPSEKIKLLRKSADRCENESRRFAVCVSGIEVLMDCQQKVAAIAYARDLHEEFGELIRKDRLRLLPNYDPITTSAVKRLRTALD